MDFYGYDIIQRHYINKNANEAIDEFDAKVNEINQNYIKNENINTNININNENLSLEEQNNENNNINSSNSSNNSNSSSSSSSSTSSKSSSKIQMQYRGFEVAGKIEIPKIKLSYPVLTTASLSSMKVSVGIIYGPGLNEIGNTVIMGHNYKNGSLFSNNKKLRNGDLIYITDLSGNRIEYVIYNRYYTSSTDFDYATRQTDGRREISLESCSDDSKTRLIIWARENK